MKKKAAFFVTSLNSGGIENYLLRFLTHYQHEIDATVYCKSGRSGDLEKEYHDINVRIKTIKIGYFDLRSFQKINEEFASSGYGSVCDFTGNFAGIVLYIAKKNKIRSRIAFYRGSDNHFREDSFRLLYDRIVKKLTRYSATHILANSKTALDYFYPGRSLDDDRFDVVYNGINTEKFISTRENLRAGLKIPADAFVTGHIGRFNKAKNHKTIIEVAVRLCRSDKNIYFILCGDKVDENLQARVDKEGLGDQIILLGYRKDVIKVLNTMDCFYFPSITEGQPNALIEALIVGLPFVASDINPIKETIPQSFFSQLVPPDDIDMAVRKILQIYSKEKTVNLKDWAIKNYSAAFWFEKLYKKL